MRPALAAALIVRDEAELLEGCLESVARFADEICVVDTGSTDTTLDIARRFNAIIDTLPWSNDFSEARNRSLALCSADWVFVIDADERIAVEDAAALRDLALKPDLLAYRLVTRNYTNRSDLSEFHACRADDPHARGFRGWFPSAKVRLFPNHRGIRFQGRVHELVNASLEREGLAIVDCPIPVHHYPLLKDETRVRGKRELYVALGRAKAEEHPLDPKAHAELGDQLVENGAWLEGLAAYRSALRLRPDDADVLRSLGAVLYLLARHDEAEKALRLSLRQNPASADAWRNLGVVLAAKDRWSEAGACFTRALALRPDWQEGHGYLALALANQGRFTEAAAAAEEALLAAPESSRNVPAFLDIMTRCGRLEDARATLARLGIALPR